MMRLKARLLAIAYIASIQLIGCAHIDSTNASASSTPTLVGTWKDPGKIPLVNRDLNQHWIQMRFTKDGTMHVKYQAGMPVSSGDMSPGYIMTLMKPKNEDLPYDDLGNGKLRVTYGNQAVTYTYEITRDKLYITPPAELGSAAASVYDRVDRE